MLEARKAEPNGMIRDLFPSPVGLFEWPNTDQLNAELRTAIMARFNSSPGLVSSNRNGWHSKWDLHRWPEPCVAQLMAMLQASSSQLAAHLLRGTNSGLSQDWQIRKCWANVNPPGGYNQAHHHIQAGSLLSGVYYVDIGDCPDPNLAGRTVLQDRSGAAWLKHPDPLSREYAVTPKPGTLLLFPAALLHYVEPYRGKSRRISIAFDLMHPELDALYYPDMPDPTWWWRNFRGLMLLRSKIPEKMRALARFMPYLVEEFRRPRANASLMQRIKVTRDRAEADEAEARELASGRITADGRLPEKRPFA